MCRRLKFIIEIDGYMHRFKAAEDNKRDRKLRDLGYMVVRFSETEIMKDLDNVVRVSEQFVPEGQSP